MKTHKHNRKSSFVVYNDNDINHVSAGPIYGQPWRGTEQVWEEIESEQYYDFVLEIQELILRRGRFLI